MAKITVKPMKKKEMLPFKTRVEIANWLVFMSEGAGTEGETGANALNGMTIPQITAACEEALLLRGLSPEVVRNIAKQMDVSWEKPTRVSKLAELEAEVARLMDENVALKEELESTRP